MTDLIAEVKTDVAKVEGEVKTFIAKVEADVKTMTTDELVSSIAAATQGINWAHAELRNRMNAVQDEVTKIKAQVSAIKVI